MREREFLMKKTTTAKQNKTKKKHSEQSNRIQAIHPRDLRQYPLFPVLRITRYDLQIHKNSIIVNYYSWKRENQIVLRTHSKALYARLKCERDSRISEKVA